MKLNHAGLGQQTANLTENGAIVIELTMQFSEFVTRTRHGNRAV
jgi:hypothetical protein